MEIIARNTRRVNGWPVNGAPARQGFGRRPLSPAGAPPEHSTGRVDTRRLSRDVVWVSRGA